MVAVGGDGDVVGDLGVHAKVFRLHRPTVQLYGLDLQLYLVVFRDGVALQDRRQRSRQQRGGGVVAGVIHGLYS